MRRDFRDFLQDVLDSINDIESFTDGMGSKAFKRDRKTILAVIRCIEVMGEAANKVPMFIKQEHPEVPWKALVEMRNRMIHEYFGVDTEILWQTVKEDIPPLKPLIRQLWSRDVAA
ncbi:MAG: DUF86 domain-containing protein [Chloroflexi bacterium]|nr:DUF86 domain-containing protein [Chloroflexota bacterium]